MGFDITTFDIDKTYRIAKAVASSGLFKDVRTAEAAMVKIMAGQEIGIGPIQALSGIHVIEARGQIKVAIGAGIMAGRVKAHPGYDYVIHKLTNTECDIEFFSVDPDGKRTSLGHSPFTMADATNAKVASRDNWQNYPRNMLFSRSMTNGVRWYCGDVLYGHTPDELGALDDDSAIDPEVDAIVAEFREVEEPAPAPAAKNGREASSLTADLDAIAAEEPAEEVEPEAADEAELGEDSVVLDVLMALEDAKGDSAALANIYNKTITQLDPDRAQSVRPVFDALMAEAAPKRGRR